MRNAEEPEKNTRNVFIGYLMVFISYATVGCLGYIGFMGTDFKQYFIDHASKSNAG